MKVNYGGLEMRLVRVINFSRVPVLSDDGTSYLFTEFNLQAVGVVNSQERNFVGEGGKALGMSYKRGNAGDPLAVTEAVEPETNPVITDRAIRHWMSVNRRTLTLKSSNDILLQSPSSLRVCDAHVGPVVNSYSVQEMMGDARTFIVSFDITTYVNECETAEGKGAALLANRWSQSHELDEHYGLTIVTTGTAYFRTDLLHTEGINPDSIRPKLFLPIPVGFKRENIKIQGSGDGSRLDYSFVDVQHPHQFVAGDEIGANKIEATFSQFLRTSGDFSGGMLGAVDRIQNRRWLKGAGATESKPPTVPPAGTGKAPKKPPKPKKKP